MSRVFLPVALAASLFAAIVAHAHNAGIDNRWLDELKQPNGISCCSGHDCFITSARVGPDGWEAKNQAGVWVKIPNEIIIHNKGNPTGEPVLCYNHNRPLCFVEPIGA